MRARFIATVRQADPGLLAAIGAMLVWGNLPLYWYFLSDVSPGLILSHRIVWSCALLLPLIAFKHRMGEVIAAAKNAKTLFGLFCSSAILALNWLIFIWGVLNGKVLEMSLGYYINPLIVICLGVVLFRDRPGRTRSIAIAIAAAGVAAEVAINGAVPWAGLSVAVSFAVYALLRKLTPVESLPGLTLETLIMFPFALGFILWSGYSGTEPSWGANTREFLLLIGTGVVTSTPLVLYTYGTRHIPFTTLGIVQYLSPTISFLIGIFVFGETFSLGRVVSFCAIWIALALYTADSLRIHALRTGKRRGKTENTAGPENRDAAEDREK